MVNELKALQDMGLNPTFDMVVELLTYHDFMSRTFIDRLEDMCRREQRRIDTSIPG